MTSDHQWLHEALNKRKEQGLYRYVPDYSGLIDFCSNDYLGIARNNSFDDIRSKVLTKYGVINTHGATGSRLISGNSLLAEDTEKYIASYHGSESALIYSSGYAANVGLISAVAGRGDTIITDELIHASLIDGTRLSHAQRLRFAHNDISDLDLKLQKASGKAFVVIESVYSMDGDLAPLKEIVRVCNAYNAYLIVDEAHAVGVFGVRGEGLVAHEGLEKDVWARVVTFGKAMGIHGAAVLGNKALTDYLVNFSRSFIFSTALPPEAYASIWAAYSIAENAKTEREKLTVNTEYFRERAEVSQLNILDSGSAIQGVFVDGNSEGKEKEALLRDKGIACKAILSPTVPVGKERLRISIHAFNSKDEIDLLIKTLDDA